MVRTRKKKKRKEKIREKRRKYNLKQIAVLIKDWRKKKVLYLFMYRSK